MALPRFDCSRREEPSQGTRGKIPELDETTHRTPETLAWRRPERRAISAATQTVCRWRLRRSSVTDIAVNVRNLDERVAVVDRGSR
jgi:hypothetical protein